MSISSRKGNKSYLAEKPCQYCKRTITRRKKRAKNRSEIRYCSNKCKKAVRKN